MSCGEKSVEPDHPLIDIEMEYSPNPAIVNSTITFKFESVEAGEAHNDDHSDGDDHLAISMVTCEIGGHEGGDHSEMTLSKDDHGNHYEGTWIFEEAGHYEIHFGYMHDGEMKEKEFEIEVSD
jgi:hypothetical protein